MPLKLGATETLRFIPLLRRALWGGRRLGTHLNKPLGDDDDYAESWEVVDHGPDQSVVRAGRHAGWTLQELAAREPESLFGRHAEQAKGALDRFPLLMKFLDCNQTLSVQVHPNDQQAALLNPPDLGKTEAWVVLAANPGSCVYAGLKSGVTRNELERALGSGACADCLHKTLVQAGDCIFIPAGTVHALGEGLLIAEIQQASDTTYRLFDWNRVDKAGMPRKLHIEESLGVIDFERGPVAIQSPRRSNDDPNCELLAECDKFVLNRRFLDHPRELGGDGAFHLVVVLEGAVELDRDPVGAPLMRGETALLPAAAGKVGVRPMGPVTLLDIRLP